MKRVLVPLDGTKNAEDALPFLAEICDPGDSVTLLTVAKPEAPAKIGTAPGRPVRGGFAGPSGGIVGLVTPDSPVFEETRDQTLGRQRNEAQEYLEHIAGPLRGSGLDVKTEVVLDERPGHTIIEYARETKPTMIALLRRTHLGISERFFGSVATEITEAEVAPVLFVPPAKHNGKA